MGTTAGGNVLVPHPETPPNAISGVTFAMVWKDAGEWSLDFIVTEPPEALRLLPAAPRARVDGLWRHTCFELFLRPVGSDAYWEFNFSPSGEWAAYRFDRYRDGLAELEVEAPLITSAEPAQFRLGMEAHLLGLGIDADSVKRMLDLTPDHGPAPVGQYALSACLQNRLLPSATGWLANIAAVIEEADGTKSYWALAHPPGPPDFHHPDCFVLELPAPSHT